MEKLVQGVHSFSKDYFAKHRRLFETLATRGQRPEALFITCSDSRVIPELITSAAPGELFIVRNVGNIVPPDSALQWGGVSSAIEYAVQALNVGTIIVCGHTQCGAIQAILQTEQEQLGRDLPRVARWLKSTRRRIHAILAERYGDLTGAAREMAAIEENVLVQLEHLRTFPFVANKLESGTLQVSGWVFDIGGGRIFDYDPSIEQFLPLEAAHGTGVK